MPLIKKYPSTLVCFKDIVFIIRLRYMKNNHISYFNKIHPAR
ncbi:hypothetical protein HMPREF3293_00344 [Christensenella minuta]|uniref:Uncharacterized protein n=1 Tax=Christensenella minuta TaxID=626937 RepID=A0A136Q7Z0_9FIRM|nr:hypothetical protein HMPREF3293_00344 [Christensenella minuta]